MKRYNLRADYVDTGLDPRRPVHSSILTIHEEENGEWVRYEDVQVLIDREESYQADLAYRNKLQESHE
jgi:hypothetical protein